MLAKIKNKLALQLMDWQLENQYTPPRSRVVLFGYGIAITHIILGLALTYVQPQHFESLWLRMVMVLIAMLMVLHAKYQIIPRVNLQLVFDVQIWIHLMFFPMFMLIHNGFNHEWFSYTCTSLILAFMLVRWHKVLIGLGASIIVFYLAYQFHHGKIVFFDEHQHFAIAFLTLLLGLFYARLFKSTRGDGFRQALAAIVSVQTDLNPNIKSIMRHVDEIPQILPHAQPPSSVKHLKQVHAALQNSARGIETYLSIQRNNAKFYGDRQNKVLISAEGLVRHVVSNYPYSDPRLHRAIKIHIEKDFYFKGNRDEWEQVIRNLLKNAKDALAATKLHIHSGDLNLQVKTEDGYGRIAVHNHGLPIPEEKIKYIFNAFYSGSSGLGLGLAYCRYIALKEGGRISVLSNAADGTVFKIYLPALPVPASADMAKQDVSAKSKGQV